MSFGLLQLLMIAPVPTGLVLTGLIACDLRLRARTPRAKLL